MNNWPKAVNDLIKKGYTQELLAEKFNCSQSFISQLSNGHKTRVTFELGERIVALCLIERIQIIKQQKTPSVS